MNPKEISEEIQTKAQLLLDEVNSLHCYLCSLKPVGHMSQQELDDKELIERGQAAARGVIDCVKTVESILIRMKEKYE